MPNLFAPIRTCAPTHILGTSNGQTGLGETAFLFGGGTWGMIG
eukprot:CAMPEP_0169162090 /NCGR_PEP_ID=MMETSP1015-20121227/57443_1 /TAXON_ID=342587 /ORGANISM="Karlodinium micrum, Strain CCMP2283" /LENGTH=42 /DNA_ID= /DNA_START= /DNA_END= /DNA_ORIENTATION=